jgi:hypothetical protein
VCKSYSVFANFGVPFDATMPERECGIVHLASNENAYNTKRYPWSAENVKRARLVKNELWKVANGV